MSEDEELRADMACGALLAIDFLLDLFTISSKENFKREEVLIVLNQARHDPELVDPAGLAMYERAVAEIGGVV